MHQVAHKGGKAPNHFHIVLDHTRNQVEGNKDGHKGDEHHQGLQNREAVADEEVETQQFIGGFLEFCILIFFLNKGFHHPNTLQVFFGNAVHFFHQGLKFPKTGTHLTHDQSHHSSDQDHHDNNHPPEFWQGLDRHEKGTNKEQGHPHQDGKEHHDQVLDLRHIIGHADYQIASIKFFDVGVGETLNFPESLLTNIGRNSLGNLSRHNGVDQTGHQTNPRDDEEPFSHTENLILIIHQDSRQNLF